MTHVFLYAYEMYILSIFFEIYVYTMYVSILF